MLQWERHQHILELLEQEQSSTIKALAKKLFTSEATVRRDVAQLEAQGLIQRVYGGVLLCKYQNGIVPADLRDADNAASKQIIATRAAKLIQSGDTVLMDASTTVFRICRHLQGLKNVKIITNNLRICTELANNREITVYCTGGAYSQRNHCFLGSYAESFIRNIHADLLFFSAQSIDAAGVITDVDEQEISMRQTMMTRADKRIFLCDSSKFGIRRPFRLCEKNDVDRIICETELQFHTEEA